MSYLGHAAVKKGSTLMAVDPAQTSRRRAECGELIHKDGEAGFEMSKWAIVQPGREPGTGIFFRQ
jgi:hypothetical protein